jgi:hypothetical protein
MSKYVVEVGRATKRGSILPPAFMRLKNPYAASAADEQSQSKAPNNSNVIRCGVFRSL